MIDQELLTSERDFEQYYQRMLLDEGALIADVRIDPVADTLTQFYEGRFGVVRGGNTEVYDLNNGRSFTLESRWTATLIEQDGDWKIVALHTGVNFADNPVLDFARRFGWILGGSGLVLGLVLGVLLGRILRSKPAPAPGVA